MKKLVSRFRLLQFLMVFGIIMCSSSAFAAAGFATYSGMTYGGQRFLLSTQNTATYDANTKMYTGGGYWDDDGYSSGYRVATTAFCVAALMDTGISKSDPHVIGAINYLLSQVQAIGIISNTGNTNYDNNSALIALSVYGDPPTEIGRAHV